MNLVNLVISDPLNILSETLLLDSAAQERSQRSLQTAAYFAAFIALGLSTGSLGPTLPGLAAQLNVGLGAISYLFTARSLGYVIGSVRSGSLFDNRPAHVVLGTMLLLMSLAMVLVPLTGHLSVMLGLMMLLGAAESGLDVGANTLLVRLHAKRVGPFMTALHSFFGIGALVAPLIVAQTNLLGYETVTSYFVLAFLVLPIAAYTIRLPNQIHASAPPQTSSGATNRSFVFLIALFLFLYVGAEVGFAGWIFTYATEQRLAAPVTAAYLTSLFWGSLTAGRIAMIPLTARIRPTLILLIGITGSLLSVGLIIVAPSSVVIVFAGSIGLGLFMAPIFPTALSFASRRIEMTGRVTAWLVVGGSLGCMLVPWLIGQLFETLGPRSLVYVAELTLLLAAVVLAVALQRTKASRVREADGWK